MCNFLEGKIGWLLSALAALVLLAIGAVWLALPPFELFAVKDFEACTEQAQSEASTRADRTARITRCGERFAGRRKAGGGYAYYDFMQDRTFDIAGPNPTEEERKQIDHAYIDFLDAQRREAILSDLAKRRTEKDRLALEGVDQHAGPPLVLTPKIPLPVKRPLARSKDIACEDGSLSCSWAKLSEAVKRAFASSSKPGP